MKTKSQPVLSIPESANKSVGPSIFGRFSLADVSVLAAVLFNLLTLAKEKLVVFYPNDNGMHLQMTSFAGTLLGQHQSPFDHW